MRRNAVVAVLLAVLLLVAAAAAGGAAAAQEDDEEADVPFGAEVSSFMQASSADAEGGVDDGMFEAAWERADTDEERAEVVERRRARLEARQERLQDRNASIDHENPSVADRAMAAHVSVGASNLEQSVRATERAAEAAGLDTQALAEIRANASELRGQEVADLARGLVGTPHDDEHPSADAPGLNDTDGDPGANPDERGEGADESGGNEGNESGGNEGNESGGNEGNESGGAGEAGNGTDRDESDNPGTDGQSDNRTDAQDSDQGDNGNDDRGGGQNGWPARD